MVDVESLETLEKLILLCKKHRVNSMAFGDLKFELELPPTDEQIQAAKDMADLMAKQTGVSDEEILFNPMAGLEERGDGYAYNEHT